jgi:hypothetical protein
MRFSALARLSFLAVLVSAQTSKTDTSTSNDLLAEFQKLPTCAVRIENASLVHYAQLTPTRDQLHHAFPHPSLKLRSR